jgi:hypothetical protein
MRWMTTSQVKCRSLFWSKNNKGQQTTMTRKHQNGPSFSQSRHHDNSRGNIVQENTPEGMTLSTRVKSFAVGGNCGTIIYARVHFRPDLGTKSIVLGSQDSKRLIGKECVSATAKDLGDDELRLRGQRNQREDIFLALKYASPTGHNSTYVSKNHVQKRKHTVLRSLLDSRN